MKLSFPLHRHFVRLPLLTAALALSAGCGRSDDSEITVYRIPKETATPAMASTQGTTDRAAPTGVHWTAPAGWEEQAPSGFRKGSFLFHSSDGKTADISVISFPQAAGGVLANVNRWRNQLKLAPVSSEAEVGTPMAVAGHDMFFVDLVSEQAGGAEGTKTRILGGILPLGGETWFFKMMGPDQVVEAQRNAFRQFLDSVQVNEETAPSAPAAAAAEEAPMSANSGGNNTNAPTPPPIETAQGAPLQYTLPPSWQEKPLSPMRLASFNAKAPNGKEADVSVVSLPGMAGGDLANVNRWRGQVKLPPIDENTLATTAEHVKANGHDFLLVDLAGAAPKSEKEETQRILAAILDENDRSWFIKMIGDDAAVESQKPAFTNFLQSLKIP